MLQTSSVQIEVSITGMDRDLGCVHGVKVNKQRGHSMSFFSVWFRDGEPIKLDGMNRPHPKLVLAAASAAWRNAA